jgi:hypothetical protein
MLTRRPCPIKEGPRLSVVAGGPLVEDISELGQGGSFREPTSGFVRCLSDWIQGVPFAPCSEWLTRIASSSRIALSHR